ncbi:MAG: hypothetical protein JO334_11310 [Verrucomicrobia bacterium]|nr:hypothetical protein [Verrucomicrobiota bacterium]
MRVRTNYGQEDIYLYRTLVKPVRARSIFSTTFDPSTPLTNIRVHNELTSNCTTNVRVHTAATAVGKPPAWDWRILINGYAEQMWYERLCGG